MLVLSRRENQTITFPDFGITIQVLRTGGHQVRIGIDAPRNIRVLRGELMEDSIPCEHLELETSELV